MQDIPALGGIAMELGPTMASKEEPMKWATSSGIKVLGRYRVSSDKVYWPRSMVSWWSE